MSKEKVKKNAFPHLLDNLDNLFHTLYVTKTLIVIGLRLKYVLCVLWFVFSLVEFVFTCHSDFGVLKYVSFRNQANKITLQLRGLSYMSSWCFTHLYFFKMKKKAAPRITAVMVPTTAGMMM